MDLLVTLIAGALCADLAARVLRRLDLGTITTPAAGTAGGWLGGQALVLLGAETATGAGLAWQAGAGAVGGVALLWVIAGLRGVLTR